MNLKRTNFDNLSEFLDYLYKILYINYISTSFEFTDITIKNSVMNFHVYVLPKGFTFKSNEEVNTVISRCTSNDTYTQIIIGHNIKVNSGVTLTPPKRCKGLIIYDKGMLSNFGSISMYARGCIAIGQDIYLTHTEFVPAIGSAGGASNAPTYGWSGGNGNNGINGSNRKSGGGGAGAYRYYNSENNNKNGAGSSGTSYSGGSGGGAGMYNHDDVGGISSSNPNPVSNGGKGGNGSTSIWYFDGIFASGGQGNPSGGVSSKGSVSYNIPQNQPEGTGGLLIIYCDNLYNTGNINANGVIAKYVNVTISVTNNYGRSSGAGGSSGGGSLNIFCNRLYDGLSKGTITSNGGASQLNAVNGTENFRGGAGGNGCVTIDALETYTEFEYDDSLYNNNEYIELEESIISVDDSSTGYYKSDLITYNGHNEQYYPIQPYVIYYIECWGARGSSEDGDIYTGKQEGEYGSYLYGTLILDHVETLKISIGESGGCGGGGWPEYKYEERTWGEGNTKNISIRSTVGGSTSIKSSDDNLIVLSSGGKSGTTTAPEASSEARYKVDLSLVDSSITTLSKSECYVISQNASRVTLKYNKVLEYEYKSIIMFAVDTQVTLAFYYRIDNDDFAEFRVVRADYRSDSGKPTMTENHWYSSGSSGEIYMEISDFTPYFIQVKASQNINFECDFIQRYRDLSNTTHLYYGSGIVCTDIFPNATLNTYHGGVGSGGIRTVGPILPTTTNYNSLLQNTNYNFNSKQPPIEAGYHGAVKITRYIEGDNGTGLYQFTGKTKKITLVPDKLGSRYVKTSFILECYGGSGYDYYNSQLSYGDYVKGRMTIDNITELYLNIGNKGGYNAEAWNSGKKSYKPFFGLYGYECSGGNTDISLCGEDNSEEWNNDTHLNNIIIRAKGGNAIYNEDVNIDLETNRDFLIFYNAKDFVSKINIDNKNYITYSYITCNQIDGRVTEAYTSRNIYPICIKPIKSGTLTFYSNNNNGDTYGYVNKVENNSPSDSSYWTNDDSGGNRNFRISATVEAGTIYCLKCGTFNNNNSSYDYHATYPDSILYVIINNRLFKVDLHDNISIPFNNENSYVNNIISDYEVTEKYNSGNGFIIISKLPRLNDDYILDPDPIIYAKNV